MSNESLSLAAQALKTLKDKAFQLSKSAAPEYKELEVSAVGTHAVRTAKNQSDLARKFEELGIPMLALTQEQEAQIGFEAVKTRASGCEGKNLMVWDVGGGSMQITLSSPQGAEVFGLPFGSEAFKAELVKQLKLSGRPAANCAVSSLTPNPIGRKNLAKVKGFARQKARALPSRLRFAVKSGVCAIGIGGVHGKAVEGRIEKLFPSIQGCACDSKNKSCSHASGEVSRREVECLAKTLIDKNDCAPEINGPYSTTSVSNLFLVAGFMEAMNINRMRTLNVNMGHGLVADSTRLKFKTIPIQ
ncbi:MAG: hypothetical protein HC902_08330 [Calothrix sp. SM1_5_4]|nr:hypothetical protein [Calothrix sp. SM1_5_4]